MAHIITPYKGSRLSKKEQVALMFNRIASHYDFLNHFLSLGIDRRWRRRAIDLLRPSAPKKILDVATGTADFAMECMRLAPHQIIGVDISEAMLGIGKKKIEKSGWGSSIELLKADSENLPFGDNSFDAITVAFGVRNFENLKAGLSEMKRVLKRQGQLVVLEFSKPKTFPLKQLFALYFRFILPAAGKLISKDKAAYAYLPESVKAFPEGNEFVKLLGEAGFQSIRCIPLTFGVCSIYIGEK